MTLITNAESRSRLFKIRTKIAALEAELAILHAQECTVRATLDAIVYPQLCKLRLSFLTWSQIALPWSQLTDLTLYGQSLANSLDILQHTPNLVALNASVTGIDSPATFIVLPHLRIISTSYPALLERITTPALVDLSIDCFDCYGELVVPDLIDRSGCALQKLRLNSFPDGGGSLWDGTSLWEAEFCLSAAPSLRSISLSGIGDCDPEVWELIFGRIADGTLVPVVESLTLSHLKAGIPICVISSMLSARAKVVDGVGKIASFKCFEGKDPLLEGNVDRALSDLRELRAQGMTIEIGWGPNSYRDCAIWWAEG